MARHSFSLVTLGCAKNQVDSEVIAGELIQAGFRATGELEEAAVIIVNTCGFIEKAREESIQTLLELARYKKTGKCRTLVAFGCLVQRHMTALQNAMEEIDFLVSLDDLSHLGAILKGERSPLNGSGKKPTFLYDGDVPRFIENGAVSAYLKISEGCDHRCAYCTIPQIRGDLRSRSIPSIIREARFLMGKGIKELNVVSHDCTAYGRDLGMNHGLTDLLGEILKLDRFHWIRLLYLYPYTIPQALTDFLKNEPRLCPYLDIPLQHCDEEILRHMGRPGDLRPVLSMIEKIRRRMPELTVRTTFIVGYPGETQKKFQALIRFCEEMAFDRVGVFTYSPEDQTAAARLKGHVSETEKNRRYEELMTVQQKISEKKNRSLIGRTMEVLLEGYHPETDLLLRGRTAAMAPEVDGDVLINDGEGDFGEFVQVEVMEAYAYDLIGRIKPGATE